MFGQPPSRFQAIAGVVLVAGAILGAAGAYRLHHQAGTALAAANVVPITVLPAGASGAPRAGPGYFTVTARPGQTVHLHALIVNRTHSRPLLALAPVDAYRTASGLGYALPSDNRRGVGAWIHLSRHTLTMAPASRRLIDLSCHVPADARAGTYAGALSIALPGSGTVPSASASIRVQMRLAVAVIVHVRTASRG